MKKRKWKDARLSQPVVLEKTKNTLAVMAGHSDEYNWDQVATEHTKKIMLLFAEFGIKPGDWAELCVALAYLFVPGMKIAKPPGRTKEWDYFDYAELHIAIDSIVKSEKCSLIKAAQILIKSAKQGEKYKRRSAETLKRYYSKASLSLVAKMKSAKKVDRETVATIRRGRARD